MKKIGALSVFLLFLGISMPSLAGDAAAAKAAYMRGTQKQTAKDYQGAIAEYQAALDAEPRYVYANKQMGTCWYYLGDKSRALANYDTYLAVVPNDTAIQKFADSLRAQGVAAAAMDDGGTKNNLYTNSLALALTLFNVGYERRFGSGSLKVEGMFRSWGISGAGYNESVSLMGGALGWRFYLGGKKDLTGFFVGPGVNFFSLNDSVSSPSGGSTLSVTSTSFGLGGELGYQFIFGKAFSLTPAASFSYQMASTSSNISGLSTYSISGTIPGIYLNLGYAF